MQHGEHYSMHRVYINEGILGSPLIAFASTLQQVENALVKQNGGDVKKAVAAANDARKNFLKAENKISDENILAAITMMYYMDVEKNQRPIGFFESIKGSYGDLNNDRYL